MKLTYHYEGDYLIPDLVPPESPNIGIWGERRRRFLRAHKRPLYDAMLMNGTLNSHLEEIDRTAEEMLDRLIEQMAEREAITENLKATNQLAWVQQMNAIRVAAEEIVNHELIYQRKKMAGSQSSAIPFFLPLHPNLIQLINLIRRKFSFVFLFFVDPPT